MKIKLLFALLLTTFATFGQTTLIPDSKFEDKLISLGIDTDGKNGSVLTSSINSIVSLNLTTSSITDLTGIQDFTALKSLNCYGNYSLTSIDVTNNLVLESLSLLYTKITAIDLSNNINLKVLSVPTSYLISLDVTKNINLTSLTASPNGSNPGTAGTGKLTTLDVSKNVKLKTLDCSENNIETFDFTNNTLLETLSCGGNKVTNIDLSKNVVVTNLSLYNSLLLENIDLSNNTKIITLDVSYSNLKTLDVSGNLDLKVFKADANALVSIDLSQNIALTAFTCENTKLLNSINLKNGTNTSLSATNLKMKSNPNLFCIVVDDVTYSNTNWLGTKDVAADFSSTQCTTPAYTLIPDTNFEKALIYFGIDAIEDGKVITKRAQVVKELKINNYYTGNLAIADMTGIQDFRDLEILTLPPNGVIKNLTTLDVSNNLQLKELFVTSSKITSLDVSKNILLTSLQCYGNNLTSLDVFKNLSLNFLDCSNNKITSLDVSKNTSLIKLSFSANQLTSIDVSKNLSLDFLFCSYNKITSLDVSKNTSLTRLSFDSNQLTSIDISNNTDLKLLSCSFNKLTSLDVSQHQQLTSIRCNNNLLQYLNIKNGNNINFLQYNYNFKFNPSLTCIQVDDENYANANWASVKDVSASYNTSCPILGITSLAFDKSILYPNPVKEVLHIDNVLLEKVRLYNTLGKLVKNETFKTTSLNTSITLSGLPKGIYYIYLESEGNTMVKKIIVD